ncbi:MAG: NADPH-dependent 7-cyano-7-deazaguanine reductase QueF, partial [Candidatus Omnitrophota bacterium]
VELKSFKLYIVSYRDVGIFHEHAVNKILDDFVEACKPRWAHIRMVFNSRGGITTTVEAEYNAM